jgi:2-dehydro-3-deoxygalactonokinase
MNDTPANILIDWGSSSFRAEVHGANGQIIETIERPDQGVLTSFSKNSASVRTSAFQNFLQGAIGKYTNDNNPVSILMCGMIGSQSGWVEVPYVSAPTDVFTLSKNIRYLSEQERGPFAACRIGIVPGINRYDDYTQRGEIMRGEETKVFGVMDKVYTRESVICMPGTHCKWVLTQGAKIAGFHTFMTGSLYDTAHKIDGIKEILNAPQSEDTLEKENSFHRGLSLAMQNCAQQADIFQMGLQ